MNEYYYNLKNNYFLKKLLWKTVTVAHDSVWFMALSHRMVGVYERFNSSTVFIVWLELNAVPSLRP